MRRVLEKVVLALASFRLAFSLFAMLLVVVLVGTLEQQHLSLYEVQRKYFSSLFFATPIPFPGGALLLGLLFLNLTIGGLLRIRWKTATLGVIIVHVGILMLLVGGFVEYRLSSKGFIHFAKEGEHGDRYYSYEDWDLTIERAGPDAKQWIAPTEEVSRATDGRTVRVTAPDLPFDVLLSGYARNTELRRARSASDGIDGVEMFEVSSSSLDGGSNLPGVVATAAGKGAVAATGDARGYLRGGEGVYAWTVAREGVDYRVALTRRSWPLPFDTRLDRAIGEKHPGTEGGRAMEMFRRFSSFVTVNDGGVSREVHITMNEPLRWKGTIFYQSGFGRYLDGSPWSTLAVVQNPSDRVPIVACVIIAIGMVLHFGLRLLRFLYAGSVRRFRQSDALVGSSADGRSPEGPSPQEAP